MIRKTLFVKLLLLFIGFGALLMGAFVYVMGVSHEQFHAEFDQTANRALAGQYVARDLLVGDTQLTGRNLDTALKHITEINPEVDAYVLDAKGLILASSLADGRLMRRAVDVEQIKGFLAAEPKFPLRAENPADANGRDVFSAAPLSIPGSSAAYLYVVLHREQDAGGASGLKTLYAVREGAGVLFIAVALAVAGSLLLLRMLTHRLSALQLDIERFRDSDFASLPKQGDSSPIGDDEIGRLRQLFIELAAQIRSQLQELQKTDTMRQELIANVSHDLRTPLATLLAHLETLSMKDDLPPEERRAYLGTALAQCRRLGSLVEQLLELAKLDAGQTAFLPEPFQLAELAHDVASKLELSARRTRTTVRIDHPDRLPLVMGDIRLMDRVLYNLIDNAIRHAGEGGCVTLRLIDCHDTVRVEVRDTGPGIPAGERNRIFQRFYRGDKSRATESGYAGLGLAIARGILELHGQRIDFVSPPKEGATFHFELSTVRIKAPSDSSLHQEKTTRKVAG